MNVQERAALGIDLDHIVRLEKVVHRRQVVCLSQGVCISHITQVIGFII